MDAGEDWHQESRGKCDQDHALVAAMGVNWVEDLKGDCEDGELQDGVGDGNSNPPP